MLACLMLFTFPGAPSIYYGSEIGLTGGLPPDCRRGFPEPSRWNQDDPGAPPAADRAEAGAPGAENRRVPFGARRGEDLRPRAQRRA